MKGEFFKESYKAELDEAVELIGLNPLVYSQQQTVYLKNISSILSAHASRSSEAGRFLGMFPNAVNVTE